jgi:hypothetical protein
VFCFFTKPFTNSISGSLQLFSEKYAKQIFLTVQDITSPLNEMSKKGLVKELTLLKDLLRVLHVLQNKTVQTGCGAYLTAYSVPGILSSD